MNIVFYGDSNTWGYDPTDKFGEYYPRRWTEIFAELTGHSVVNEGVNGREVPDEPACVDPGTDLLVIMLGTNDLLQLDTPEAAAARMEIFLSGIDPRKAVLLAPPAMVWGEWVQEQELIDDSIRLASLYEGLAQRLGVRFLDAGSWNIPLCFDGVHFTQAAQQLFAERLAKELNV